jgi:hypothetical protein
MICKKCNKDKQDSLFPLNYQTKRNYKVCNDCRNLKSNAISRNKELFENGLKVCSRCYIQKEISEFINSKKGMNGLLSDCKECCHKRETIHRRNNLDKYKGYSKKRRKELSKESSEYDNAFRKLYHNTIDGYGSRLYSSAKSRAIKKGLEFSITSEFIKNKLRNMKCESTGFDLVLNDEDGRVHPMKPTLDRRDNSKGYTFENTKIVCWWWNVMKQDWSEQTIKELIKKYKNE